MASPGELAPRRHMGWGGGGGTERDPDCALEILGSEGSTWTQGGVWM